MELIKFLIYCSFMAGSWTAMAQPLSVEYKATDIKGLGIDIQAGEIKINATEEPMAKVVATKIKGPESCLVKTNLKDSLLLITAPREKKLFGFFGQDCQINIEVFVPKEIAVNIDIGGGDVKVDGIKGSLSADLGAGNIDLKGEFLKVNIDNGAGNISVEGLAGDGTIDAGAGNIDVALSKVPSEGNLNVDAGTGNVTIVAPADSNINATTSAGVGETKNEFGSSPQAKYKISADSGVGNIAIRKKF